MDDISEAKRYLQNAKTFLSEKARKEEGYYIDKKYVKLAGHAAYSGVLVALDSLLGTKKKGRKSVEWYKEEISKMDKKLPLYFNDAYETLHLAMGYDGNANAKVSQAGLELADYIISWVVNRKHLTDGIK